MYTDNFMNIYFVLYAVFENKRTTPLSSKIFDAIAVSLRDIKINPLLFLSDNVMLKDNCMVYSFHPSADPVYFFMEDNTLKINIAINTMGAGYHSFIVDVVDKLAKRLNVSFFEDEESRDESEYFKNRNFDELKKYYERYLKAYSKELLDYYSQGFSRFMMSMPSGYPTIDKEYFALSPLGYFGKNWFSEVIKEEVNADIFLKEFYIWESEERDASFWFKSALSMIWVFYPFRDFLNYKEKETYEKILYALDKAYSLDKNMPYPWDIWLLIASQLKNNNVIKKVESIYPERRHNVNENIGFRKEKGENELAGGFYITMPMSMSIEKKETTLVEFRNENIYAAFEVYSFKQKETDAILDYVIKQLDEANSDKGDMIALPKLDDMFKTVAYEKVIGNEEYTLTVAIVTSHLTLLAWFTYDKAELKEKCFEYIKSIRLKN